MNHAQQNAAAFVDSLSLAELPYSVEDRGEKSLTAADPSAPSAAVIAGQIGVFGPGVPPQTKSDVINSLLIAQLHATSVVPKMNDDMMNWYAQYVDVLANIGWTLTSYTWDDVQVSGDSFSVSDELINLLTSLASSGEMALVGDALKSLQAQQSSGGSGWQLLFNSTGGSTNHGTMQISAVEENEGTVNVALAALQLTSSTTTDDVLFFSFSSSDSELKKSAQNSLLDEDVYSTVRDQIVAKLGNKAQQYVADLSI